MSGYGRFAEFYDRLTENVRYDLIAEAAERYTERFGGRKGIVLDLACGTGSLCEQLARRGFDVIGADASDGMLSAALDKKFDSGLPIQYLRQEMTQLDMFGTIDLTVCTLDSINHLPDREAVHRTFERVSLFAYPDGMFIFDVNTLHKHCDVLAQNAFAYDMGDFFCCWQNQYDPADGSVDIFLDIFERLPDGNYGRVSESFTERVWSDEEITEMLDSAGLAVLARYDDYTDAPVTDQTERVVYVTKKVK
ncbi:Methyltransferase domain-containing protein [Ruminococcaceae bacterium FB2012]|nr:Methyltransferase domain-containing protein [Ruminococcaceae bacterium FB2012]